MPIKHNTKCRHHIAKMKYTVRNWAEYDAALRCRGSLPLWVTAEAMDHWASRAVRLVGNVSILTWRSKPA